MTTPTVTQAVRWIELGSALCDREIRRLVQEGEQAFSELSAVPGWTRAHVVAHLIGNGEGVTRLLSWAASGEPSPMYASRERRNADIEERSHWGAEELQARFVTSVAEVTVALSAVPSEGWQRTVVAGQNADGSERVVPARVVPWMRAREVMVHVVDLETGVGFDALPPDFVRALADDIVAKRVVDAGEMVSEHALVGLKATDVEWSADVPGPNDWSGRSVEGSLADITAYLAGRSPLAAAPALSPWL